MKPRPTGVILLALTLLLVGCKVGVLDEPAAAAKNFFDAAASGGSPDAFYCASGSWPDGTSIKDSIASLHQTVTSTGAQVDVSGLKYETLNKTNDTADVKVSGTLKVTAANGQTSESEWPASTLKMKVEGGSWKVCGS